MVVAAPKDKKTTKARVNWLLRQLRISDVDDIYIGVIWASRASTSFFRLESLREDVEQVANENTKSEVRAFEVRLISTNVKRFKGRRTFIEDLEHTAEAFYDRVGQHLRAWQAPPPRPKHSVDDAEVLEPQTTNIVDDISNHEANQAMSVKTEPPESAHIENQVTQPESLSKADTNLLPQPKDLSQSTTAARAGNLHTDLLEISEFLVRARRPT